MYVNVCVYIYIYMQICVYINIYIYIYIYLLIYLFIYFFIYIYILYIYVFIYLFLMVEGVLWAHRVGAGCERGSELDLHPLCLPPTHLISSFYYKQIVISFAALHQPITLRASPFSVIAPFWSMKEQIQESRMLLQAHMRPTAHHSSDHFVQWFDESCAVGRMWACMSMRGSVILLSSPAILQKLPSQEKSTVPNVMLL